VAPASGTAIRFVTPTMLAAGEIDRE
jgi:hypothetical protein